MVLAEECYGLTRGFPREEAFGMTAQIRRAATSVAANIAEGHGRATTGAFVQFLRVAQGSLKEVETLLELSARVGLAKRDAVSAIQARADSIGRMVRSLMRSLKKGGRDE